MKRLACFLFCLLPALELAQTPSQPLDRLLCGPDPLAVGYVTADFPLVEVAKYSHSEDPRLRSWLKDDRMSRCWPEIVFALGMLAEQENLDETAEELKVYLVSPPLRHGYRRIQEILAKSSVPLALGLLANRGSNKALELLLQLSDAAFTLNAMTWLDRPNQKHTAIQVSIYAMRGLGYSARPEAANRLKELQKDKQINNAHVASGAIKYGLEDWAGIKKKGLIPYFESKRRKR
ncbi:MAG: hypothetical protein Q8R08_01425 [bacterium]|nr:hypothetical protein [bacterium]